VNASLRISQSQPAPGQFTIDEEAAERALERTLVAAGVLLVPFGQAEVQPTFSYTRREQDVPTQVQVGTSVSFPTEKVKRNELTGTLNCAAACPGILSWNLASHNYTQQEQVLDLGCSDARPKTAADRRSATSAWVLPKLLCVRVVGAQI
jgi:hypothetical protein